MFRYHLLKSLKTLLFILGLVGLAILTAAFGDTGGEFSNNTVMAGKIELGGATVGCREAGDSIPSDWSHIGTYNDLDTCLDDFESNFMEVRAEYLRNGNLVPGPNSLERSGGGGGGDMVCNCEHQDDTVHLCSEGRSEAECTDLQGQLCEPRPFSYEPCNRTNAVQCCNGPDWTMVLYSNLPEFEQVCVQNGGTVGSC